MKKNKEQLITLNDKIKEVLKNHFFITGIDIEILKNSIPEINDKNLISREIRKILKNYFSQFEKKIIFTVNKDIELNTFYRIINSCLGYLRVRCKEENIFVNKEYEIYNEIEHKFCIETDINNNKYQPYELVSNNMYSFMINKYFSDKIINIFKEKLIDKMKELNYNIDIMISWIDNNVFYEQIIVI